MLDPLLHAIGELASADTLEGVTRIVRRCARSLSHADGVTFVLRERDHCYYAEEDAISPLWKGSRFPLEMCISGWVMLHKQIAVIPDIYADARVPHEAYRPTFVKSLVMIPVPQDAPIAAIGAYWASGRTASWQEQYTLQALANAAGVALKNMRLYQELRRTAVEGVDSPGAPVLAGADGEPIEPAS
jgi:GAF domain-containing protein